MSKRKWVWLGCLAGIVVVLIAGVTVGGDIILNTSGMKTWIISQIESQTGGKFTFAKAHLRGIRVVLDDPKLELPEQVSGYQVIAPKKMSVSGSFPALASRKLTVTGLQGEGGSLVMSFRRADPDPKIYALPLGLSEVRFRDAIVTAANVCGWQAMAEKADVTLTQAGSGDVGIKMSAGKLTIGGLTLSDVAMSCAYKGKDCVLESLTANLNGGKMTLSARTPLIKNPEIRDAKISLSGCDLQTLLGDLGYTRKLGGKADLSASFSGFVSPQSIALYGDGKLSVKEFSAEVTLPDYAIFNEAEIFKTFRPLKNGQLSMNFVMKEREIGSDNVKITGKDWEIDGSLRYDHARTVSGDMVLTVSNALAPGIPGVARGAFEDTPDGGEKIPFRLIGSVDDIRVEMDSVLMKSLGDPLQGIGESLKGIFE